MASSTSHQHRLWANECRLLMIALEEQNLRTRARCWSDIVNRATAELNRAVDVIVRSSVEEYRYDITPSDHLSFLIQWKGLSADKLATIPATFQEYVSKAKNWMCGRRAPNYSITLYPAMIADAEGYAGRLSRHYFHARSSLAQEYLLVLMYAYLQQLCEAKVVLNEKCKRTSLLFENSIKHVSQPTVRSLKKYFEPDEWNSNVRELASYFGDKRRSEIQKVLHLQMNIPRVSPLTLGRSTTLQSAASNSLPALPAFHLPQIISMRPSIQQLQSRLQMAQQTHHDVLSGSSPSNSNSSNSSGNYGNVYAIGNVAQLQQLLVILASAMDNQQREIAALRNRVQRLESEIANNSPANGPNNQIIIHPVVMQSTNANVAPYSVYVPVQFMANNRNYNPPNSATGASGK